LSGAFLIVARFALIPFLGWCAAKGGLIRGWARQGIGFALVNICYPIMILANIWPKNFEQLWAQSALTVAFSAGITGILFAAGNLYFRRHAYKNQALWNFMLGVGNISYIGLPFLHVFFGNDGVTLAIVYGSVADLFIWLIYYPMVLVGNKRPARAVFANPCLIALLLSLALCVAGVPIPKGLSSIIDASVLLVSVVALFYIGVTLADAHIRAVFTQRLPWTFSAVKVVGIPVLCFLILLPFTGTATAAVLAVLVGSPTPLLSMVWTKEDPAAQKQAVDCFVASTLLFLTVIIPLCIVFRFPMD